MKRAQGNGDPAPAALRLLWDLVRPGKVRIVGHDEHGAVRRLKIEKPALAFGRPQPETPRFAKGDRDYGGADDHARGAIVVLSNVVAKGTIVPVKKQAIEAAVDRSPAPGHDPSDLGDRPCQGVERQRLADTARKRVVLAVRLLPARRFHQLAPGHANLVVLLWMHIPEAGKLLSIKKEEIRESACPKIVAWAQLMKDHFVIHFCFLETWLVFKNSLILRPEIS